MKKKLQDIFDIAPGFPLHFIEELSFDQKIKNLLEYPLPNSAIIKKLLDTNLVNYPYKYSSISDEPKFFQFGCYPTDLNNPDMGHVGGAIAMDVNLAIIKSIGECIERYALRNIPKKFIIKKLSDIKKLDRIRIEDFFNFTDDFLGKGGRKQAISKIMKSNLRLVKGKNIITGKGALIPAQLVYVPAKKNIFLKEPLIRWPISTGAAFGIKKEDAIYRGILGCVERDSTMIGYLSKYQAPRIILNSDTTKKIQEDLKDYHLQLYVFDFTTDLKIYTMVAIIIDDSGVEPFQVVGAKADLNPEKAVIGAILEACQSRYVIRFNSENLKVTRSKKIVDLKSRLLYWGRKTMRKHLNYLLKNKNTKPLSSLTNHAKLNSKKNVGVLLKKLGEKGIVPYSVDITPSSIKKKGFYVVKMVIPKLHPLYLIEALPHKYSERLKEYGGVKNKIPHPFP